MVRYRQADSMREECGASLTLRKNLSSPVLLFLSPLTSLSLSVSISVLGGK